MSIQTTEETFIGLNLNNKLSRFKCSYVAFQMGKVRYKVGRFHIQIG